ncbi:MAG TPA: copper homeostasis membrane protein CopD [Stellaceae bacterium]|jgi:putative copper resistance protein D|nr:copper homeostasis membrane protein CopD [Stellaceae bacterium]
MDPLLIATRALHFAGALSLVGVLGFVVFVAGDLPPRRARGLRITAQLSAAVVLLTAPLWLILVATGMSADSLAATMSAGVPKVVLLDTQFGHALGLRFALTLSLLPLITRLGRQRIVDGIAALIAAASVAAIAWQGHGGAELGHAAIAHLTADVTHLIAAALWLGALLPLMMALRGTAEAREQYAIARRFSILGVVCVAALLASGIVNTYYLVGSVAALIGTIYGRTLVLKLALVAAMLALASVNRWKLVPRLAARDSNAGQRIARHSAIEAALGLSVLAIVAVLGTMEPAVHQAIVWPLPWRFGLDMIAAMPALRDDAIFSGVAAVLGLVGLGFGLYRRKGVVIAIGLAIALGLGIHAVQLILIPATPTSYQTSPEPFTAANIATGDALFQQHCVACHGKLGEGDGPLAAQSPIPPADLLTHLPMHPEGDFFSYITEGLDKGIMPSFAAVPAAQRWDMVRAIEARYAAKMAMSTLLAEVTTQPAPRAPDFALPEPQGDTGTLSALLQNRAVLLVFAASPQSQPRLDQLAQWHDTLDREGVTVVTVAQSPAIRAAYALYERRPQVETPTAPHIEFLIDRGGDIRARWRPGDTPDWTQRATLEREIEALRVAPSVELAPAMPAGMSMGE